jgi:hypothetical protein
MSKDKARRTKRAAIVIARSVKSVPERKLEAVLMPQHDFEATKPCLDELTHHWILHNRLQNEQKQSQVGRKGAQNDCQDRKKWAEMQIRSSLGAQNPPKLSRNEKTRRAKNDMFSTQISSWFGPGFS